MKNKKHKIILISFIVIEILLCILVQLTGGILNTIVSFGAVVIAFIYSFLNFNKPKQFITYGLFATVCADIFLVVLNPMKQSLAMIFFSITQICYFIHIFNNQDRKYKLINIVTRIVVVLIVFIITIIVLKENTDFLSLISMFYYANLIMNIIFSLLMIEKNYIFTLGLIFFACCDLLIGLSIMQDQYLPVKEGTIIYFLANPGFNLAWLFYVPSQTLISLYSKKQAD